MSDVRPSSTKGDYYDTILVLMNNRGTVKHVVVIY